MGDGGSYEQSSNPLWFSLSCCLPGAMAAALYGYVLPHYAAELGPGVKPLGWVVYALVGVQALLVPFIGGYLVRLDTDGVTVMLGLLGLPIKRVAWKDISSVNLIQYLNVLEAFRGYGWRVNRMSSTTGYVLGSGPAFCFVSAGWNYVFSTGRAAEMVERAKQLREAAR